MIKQFFITKAIRVTSLIAVCVLCLVGLVAPASAVGPNDGVYTIVLSRPGATFDQLGMVSQNGSTFLLVNLFYNGSWSYAVGTVAGTTASGVLYQLSGVSYGTFSLVVSGGSITGTAVINGVVWSVAATRFF